MLTGCFMSLSLVASALTAWSILPWAWNFVIIEGYFEIRSWNIYLYVCSIWSFLASVMYYFLPESPKFFLSHGNEKEALNVVREVYCENTGKSADSFPIQSLNKVGTITPENVSLRKKLTSTLFDAKDVFRGKLLIHLAMFTSMTLVCLLTYTSLRLWFPQLSTIIENFQIDNGETARFCTMINNYTSSLSADKHIQNITGLDNVTLAEICVPKLSGSETYINAIIMGISSLICVSITGYLVHYFGQKPLMFIVLLMCAACSSSLYWTNASIQIAVLVSATCGLMQSALILQQGILIRVFPTSTRTLALSVILMVGRIGSLLGSLLFPVLLENGCMAPFLSLTGVCLAVSTLVYFLPNPRRENKESGDK